MLNLTEWLGSKKTKDALVGVFVVLLVMFVMLFASGGDVVKYGELLEVSKPYVLGALTLLGLTVAGQSLVDKSKKK